MDTVTELSAFCEKASMVRLSPMDYFSNLPWSDYQKMQTYADFMIRVAWSHRRCRLAQYSFNKLQSRPHSTTITSRLWSQDLTHRYEAFLTSLTLCIHHDYDYAFQNYHYHGKVGAAHIHRLTIPIEKKWLRQTLTVLIS
jgi:hypothetical protein